MTDINHAKCEVFADNDAVAEKMAEIFIATVQKRLKEGASIVRIALSGGSTPKRLFQILAEPENAKCIDWTKVDLFYGDERHVPAGHPDSNHAMAEENLFSHISIPAANVHPIPTSSTAQEDAALYQKELQKAYGSDVLEKDKPLFDIVMLGLGPDGHTASLFPGNPVLKEKKLWVSTSIPKEAPHERVTLTYPAINSSRLVIFLITGKGKIPMLKLLRAGDPSIPASHITSEGEILILTDRAAVGQA